MTWLFALSKISQSNAVDRTPDIATKLINAGADLAVAGARNLTVAGIGDFIDLHFDPFDPNDLKRADRALRRFGYCVYIDRESFDARRHTGQSWCSSDFPEYRSPLAFVADAPVPPEAGQQSVLYQILMTYKLVVMKKADPSGAGGWALSRTMQIDMPNRSPTFSIGIDRAMFTSRGTTLSFNSGMLTDVTVDKKSELVGFVQIPLAIANAVANVPAQIVQLKIVDTNNQAALIDANDKLIKSLESLQADTKAADAEAVAGRSLTETGRVNSAYLRCLDAFGPPDLCRAMLSGGSQ